jgi:3-dehydroquinate synthase
MKSIPVKLKDRSYRVQIGAGLLNQIGALAREATGDNAGQVVIVSNPVVDALYGGRVARSLSRAQLKTYKFITGDGERFKSARMASLLYTFLIEHRIERGDLVVALGGGVVGDLAGFVAGTYLRGIRLIQAPTTLLAQIDSSIGGKTGINHRLGKNLVGVFHQPSLVVIDTETLGTLPARELQSGLYEAIKYGVIRDRRLFNRIARNSERLKKLDEAEISHLIARSCAIKADVVARDEREGGLRRILNFGHTVGHALETVTRYRRFLHGEAVAHGMRAASLIAQRLDLLKATDREAIDSAIAGVGNLPKANTLALDGIISAMKHDKKAEGGRVTFVLPTGIGRVMIRSDVPPRVVKTALKDAFIERRT